MNERNFQLCDECGFQLLHVSASGQNFKHTPAECRTYERDAALEQAKVLRESLDWSMTVDTNNTPFGPYWTSWDHKHHCGICNAPPTKDKEAFSHETDCEWNKATELLAATTPTEGEAT